MIRIRSYATQGGPFPGKGAAPTKAEACQRPKGDSK